MQYAWARLEFKCSKKNNLSKGNSQSTDLTGLAEDLSRLTVRPASTPQLGKLSINASGTLASWSVLAGLSKGFLHLSRIFQHLGSYQDAIHYAEQSLKLFASSDICGRAAEALLTQGDVKICSGEIGESETLLTKAGMFYSMLNDTIETSHYHQSLGRLNHSKKEWRSELEAYKDASAVLQRIGETGQGRESRSTIADHAYSPLALIGTLNASVPKTVAKKPRSLAKTGTTAMKQEKSKSAEHKQGLSHRLLSLQKSLKGLEASSYISQGDLESARQILIGLSGEDGGNDCRITLRLANINISLRQAFKSMTTDPIYGILSESTISIPATKILDTRRASQNGGKPFLSSRPTGHKTAHPSPQKGRRQPPPVKQSAFENILLEAAEELMSIQGHEIQHCANATAYRFQSTASDISMVMSATSIHPIHHEIRAESVARFLG